MKSAKLLKGQEGFTLIEIIAVLIILGILAAVAVPKYVDLTEEAEQGAVNAQAANLSSGSALNFAKWKLDPGSTDAISGISNCSAATQLVEDWDSSRFSIATTAASISARFTLLPTNGSSGALECFVTSP